MTRLFLSLLAFASSLTPSHGLDQATLDLSLEPPILNTNPGPEYDAANRPGNMIIGLDRTPKGRLWAAWIGNGDSANGFLMLASSDNGGKSWIKTEKFTGVPENTLVQNIICSQHFETPPMLFSIIIAMEILNLIC